MELHQKLASYFQRYGWHYEQREDSTIVSGFQGESGKFSIIASLDENWITLLIPPFLPPISSDQHREIHEYLLKLNAQLMLVKFALIDDSEVVLMANLSAHKKLDYDLFATIIDLLSFYADDAYLHLYERIVGQEPKGEE
ncbi:MAG TPA: hypothetical protein EYH05_06770 [Anaerolineae bacterium]|nr:hypothetical protein [Anaerolineae bacterium]